MKRLSEFKDERGIEVVADLLSPISAIVSNKENATARDKNIVEFAKAILKNNARSVMDMFAILSDVEPSKYHCNAATVLRDTLIMLDDPDLLALFGLQSLTQTSAGSASENTEV